MSTAAVDPRLSPSPLALGHFIEGEHVAGAPGDRHGTVYDPATGAVRARVAFASADETAVAIAAAKAAAPAWAATPPLKRARILFRFKELIEQHHDELARLITLEHAECQAACTEAPCLQVNYRHRFRVTTADLDRLIDDLRDGALDGEIPPHGTLARVRQSIPADRAAGVVAPDQPGAPAWFPPKDPA